MPWFQIFRDGPEYEARRQKGVFEPPNLTMKQVHAAVPRHLFERSTAKSLFYIIRHFLLIAMFHSLAGRIPVVLNYVERATGQRALVQVLCKPLLWLCFWGWQGMAFAGVWCLGHEAGHDALSPHKWVNSVLGMILHSAVLTPYYSWRATHRSHHKATNDLSRDETYVPRTRKHFKLPDGKVAVKMDYAEVFEETPAYFLYKIVRRQFFGFQLYLLNNLGGNPKYPPGTSHYKPSSLLFRPEEKHLIIISDIGILAMLATLYLYAKMTSWSSFCCYYLMPWLFQHNWMVMFTFLQHGDPTIPYYRPDQWTFARGALATVDRPIFGWVGRSILHSINTDHVAHHFFSSVPFYNLPAVTEAIKPVLGDFYNYDSTPVLRALWRSLHQCKFVEDEGGVVFFKNKYGEAVLEAKLH